jgi:hypothetical protein
VLLAVDAGKGHGLRNAGGLYKSWRKQEKTSLPEAAGGT